MLEKTLVIMTKRISWSPYAPLFLLLIPLIAKLFTDEVNWSLLDFVVMGVLLLSVGFGIDLIVRRVKSTPKRILFIVLAVVVFLLIWAELAVGVFGSPFAGS